MTHLDDLDDAHLDVSSTSIRRSGHTPIGVSRCPDVQNTVEKTLPSRPDVVTRWAVLIRTQTDRVELLGQIHDTLAAAERMAGYWQAHYLDTIRAEVVSFGVPLSGAPVPLAADVVKAARAAKGDA